MLLCIGYFYCFKARHGSLYLRELFYVLKKLKSYCNCTVRKVWSMASCGCAQRHACLLSVPSTSPGVGWSIWTSQVISQSPEKSHATLIFCSEKYGWAGKDYRLWRGIASAVPSKWYICYLKFSQEPGGPYCHKEKELLKDQASGFCAGWLYKRGNITAGK